MTARFEVRDYAKDGRHGWRVYDLTTRTWGGSLFRLRNEAQQYLDHLTDGRRDVIAAWIIGTNEPGEPRSESKGGYRWRAQHERAA